MSLDPDDAPSRAELSADRIAELLADAGEYADGIGSDPAELMPAGDPPRCLYETERDLLARAEISLRGASSRAAAPMLILYRDDAYALAHALDRLGLLRLRRLLDLGLGAEDDLQEADG